MSSSKEFWQSAYSEQEHRSQSWNRLEQELMQHLRVIERYLPECSVEQFNRLCSPDAKISTNTPDDEETMTTAGIPTLRTEPTTTGSLKRPEDSTLPCPERPQKFAVSDKKSSGCICTDDGEHVSVMSLDSDDLECMRQLKELAETERAAERRIQELEWKQELYMKTIREGEKMKQNTGQVVCAAAKPDMRTLTEQLEAMNTQLKSENERLNSELAQLKRDMNCYLGKIESPITDQLRHEQARSERLVSELNCLARTAELKEHEYKSEIAALKLQLERTCASLFESAETAPKLKAQLRALQLGYGELQAELMRQKMSEARTLERLAEEYEVRTRESSSGEDTDEDDDESRGSLCVCSLGEIANRLSDTLAKVKLCESCDRIPDKLKQTVREIKEVARLVKQEVEPECAENLGSIAKQLGETLADDRGGIPDELRDMLGEIKHIADLVTRHVPPHAPFDAKTAVQEDSEEIEMMTTNED